MGFTYNNFDEEMYRLFVRRDDPSRVWILSKDLVVYNPDKQVCHLDYSYAGDPNKPAFLDEFTVVVYIDGACRGNYTPNARALCGVYFGIGSNIQYEISSASLSVPVEINRGHRVFM